MSWRGRYVSGLISSWTRRDAFQGYQKNVSEQEIDFLLAHDYELSRKDADSIGRAVAQFLSDSALFTR